MSQQLHQSIVTQLQALACSTRIHQESYHGTPHLLYGTTAAERKYIVSEIKKNHPLGLTQLIALLDLLYAGESYDERAIAGILLDRYSKIRKDIPLDKLDEWLGQLVGWAEVDGTCQSVFTSKEVLADWSNWNAFLQKLATDTNINKRRASLVLLVRPVRENTDARLRDLAITNIETLNNETPILITKAISWLLREMSGTHTKFVNEYIQQNRERIPAIAYRETTRKIETGRK